MAKYCGNCGVKLNDKQDVCLECGVLVRKEIEKKDSEFNVGFLFLGLFVPLAGIILYFCFRKTDKGSAKGAITGSLISLVLSLLLVIIGIILFFNWGLEEYEDYYYGLDPIIDDSNLKFD